MFALLIFVAASVTCRGVEGMYLSNLTNAKRIETNPAIWTEEGLWGPLLEQWTIGHSRYVFIFTIKRKNFEYLQREERINLPRVLHLF